jgi:Cu/Ag efflux pump CusA
MSTLTSIFGMMPLMLMPGVGSEIYRGLATVIVGGMIASALLTLILMPGLLRLEVSNFLAIFRGIFFRNRQQALSGQESLAR